MNGYAPKRRDNQYFTRSKVNGYSPKSEAEAAVFAQVGGYSPKSVAEATKINPKTYLFICFWANPCRFDRLFLPFFAQIGRWVSPIGGRVWGEIRKYMMRIQYVILTALILFLVRSIYDALIRSVYDGIITNVVCSIVTAILFEYMMGIYRKRMQEKISKTDSYSGQKVISCGLMNHVRGIIADGGAVYLLSDCLAFVPHKFNFSRRPITIMFSDIECVSDYRVLGLFDTRLKITLKSGKIEKFVIAETTLFYKTVLSVIQNNQFQCQLNDTHTC